MSEKKLLVVDDSDMIRRVTTRVLEKAGFTVLTAIHGLEALDVLRKEAEPPALILSDINMPELDGISLVARLRNDRELSDYSGIPVIMLTTETDPALEEEARKNQVFAWIQKPYEPEQLLQAVKKALSK